jgi:transcriptional regulatory protein RtcR
MATLAPGGRISTQIVDEEIQRLLATWNDSAQLPTEAVLQELLDKKQLEQLDLFDRAQLAFVVDVCRDVLRRKPAVRCIAVRARARPCLTMLIAFGNTWRASEQNFREFSKANPTDGC